MTDIERIWNEILGELEKGDDALPAVAFEVWIKTLEPVCIDPSGNLVLMAPTIASRNLVAHRYTESVLKALSKTPASVLAGIVFISAEEKTKYISDSPITPSIPLPNLPPVSTLPAVPTTAFNPKYTFENFVVGKRNQMAASAAKAVADTPSHAFNPLFIYGTVGLGKTHLMHAIGNQLKHERPDLKVLYVSCDRFRNELIESIGRNKTQEFREKYRLLDVLLIDDIQYIVNQTSTQEEFFHTFNDLYLNNKQIIISSDRPAKEISPLEERLRTRFVSGMVADIQPPDLELRIAILKKKAQAKGIILSDEVLNMIAAKVEDNIRELEGLLERVIYFAQLSEKLIDADLAREALGHYTDDLKGAVTEDLIIDTVCSYFNTDRASLIGKKKTKELVEPRQVCIYLIYEFLSLPLVKIGQLFGGRDHTTIMHARNKIDDAVKEGGKTAIQIKDLKNMILKK